MVIRAAAWLSIGKNAARFAEQIEVAEVSCAFAEVHIVRGFRRVGGALFEARVQLEDFVENLLGDEMDVL